MTTKCDSPDNVNRRHLAGFRKFQRAALKALDAAMGSLDKEDADTQQDATRGKTAHVKLTDMKPLVSTYNDAVVGERMVLGMEKQGPGSGQRGEVFEWPKEVTVRWVDDDEQGATHAVDS